ncbi:MAG: glutathione peroxidase [Acidobacteria bacterium]|nr:glutathione peroxidase [Acidobacteriota bacterium]
MSVCDFSATSIDGQDVPLSMFRGRVLLIVNVASRCGFTPQYEGLESLYRKYKEQGFTVLGFPCNQFGSQEPGSETEIKNFCDAQFGITFPLFAKIEVNGPQAHPLYKYLTKAKPGILGTAKIKWNFTKFLVDRDGVPLRRYAPKHQPSAIDEEIRRALEEPRS